MAMIRISKRAHFRRGTRTKRGVSRRGGGVRGATFLMKDRSQPGITISQPGSLGGPGFFSKPDKERRLKESELAKKIGEKKVQGKLQAVATFGKRTNPEVAKKAASDRTYIAETFIGKKQVPRPQGVS